MSFTSAPNTIRNKARQMAKAGLYYVYKLDNVRCYSCQVNIGKWSTINVPFVVHAMASPSCAVILNNKKSDKKGRLLCNTILHKKPTLHADINFQAVARLKHYKMFPYLRIDDAEIDLSSSDTWQNVSSNIRKKEFMIEKQQTTDNIIEKDDQWLIENPDLPFTWYIRTIQAKHWAISGSLIHLPSFDSLVNIWSNMSAVEKYTYSKLSTIDQKRATTRQIEDLYRKNGLFIGIQNSDTKRITISNQNDNLKAITVSSILSQKISNIFLAEI